MADYTVDQLFAKLEKADATGDVEAARVIADEIRRNQGGADFSQVRGSAVSVAGQPPAPERSALDSVGRELGLGGRAMLEGIGSTIGIVTDPVAFGAGKALDAVLPQKQTLSGLITGEQPQERRFGTAREGFSALADTLRLPTPETGSERVGGQITEALAGGGGLMGGGRYLATKGAGMVSRGVGDFLSSMPRTQLASLLGGSGAAGVTRESGGGTGAQTLAGLLGGLSPAVAATAGPMTIRALLRGGEAGRQKMVRAIEDFRSIGAQPSVGQAAGNTRTQGIESLLAGAPTSAGRMGAFAERQAQDIGRGLERRADGFMPNASGERAGRAIERGIADFRTRTKETQGSLYDELDALIDPQSRVSVESAERVLPQLNPSIPGAPNLSPMFQNARIRGIQDALGKDVWGAGSVATRPGMAETVSGARQSMQQQADEIARLNAENAAAVAKENARLRSLMQPEIKHVPYPTTGAADIDGEIATLLQSRVDGRLPYEALRKLRTLVGQEIEDAGLLSDVPRSKWKALYGALAQDMRVAAEEAGPEAVKAFNRANNYTRAMIDRMEQVAHVVDKNGGPESVFRAAMAGTRDGATTLRAVMQSLPEDGQRAVTAAVIKRMGKATPGRQDATGEVFSAQTFLTNWNNVSAEARRALFDRHGPQFARDMDKISRVVGRITDGSKVFANPAGTANRAAAIGYYGGLAATGGAAAVGTGVLPLAGLIVSGVGANLAARMMTNPRLVSWLARTTEMPASALPQQIIVLRQMDDPDAAELADALERQQPVRQ